MKRRNFVRNLGLGAAGLMVASGFSSFKENSFIDKLLPAPLNGGFYLPSDWIWGASVIKGEDGKYHAFASKVPGDLTFTPHWCINSVIVRGIADNPEGPFKYEEEVLPERGKQYWDGMMSHNPTIHKFDDTYLLFYIGTTYNYAKPTAGNPANREQYKEARANQRIGLATSQSVYGPWQRRSAPILQPRPDKWDALMTTNPAPCLRDDGSILLVYKSTPSQEGLLKLGVAFADNYQSPFRRLSDQPILQFGQPADASKYDRSHKHVEDPFIWWAGDHYELIMKDMNGNICGEEGGGIHATSKDGVKWKISDSPKAYSPKIKWENGEETVQANFERPQLLIENGKPTHLYAATGKGDKPWHFEHTWNMVIPLKN